jgi:hypothetical protein
MKQTLFAAVLAAAFGLAGAPAFAAACKVEATNKKLAGAALTSFMKKCESNAVEVCDKSAAERKLAGAAKASYTKKCLAEAVGS